MIDDVGHGRICNVIATDASNSVYLHLRRRECKNAAQRTSVSLSE